MVGLSNLRVYCLVLHNSVIEAGRWNIHQIDLKLSCVCNATKKVCWGLWNWLSTPQLWIIISLSRGKIIIALFWINECYIAGWLEISRILHGAVYKIFDRSEAIECTETYYSKSVNSIRLSEWISIDIAEHISLAYLYTSKTVKSK